MHMRLSMPERSDAWFRICEAASSDLSWWAAIEKYAHSHPQHFPHGTDMTALQTETRRFFVLKAIIGDTDACLLSPRSWLTSRGTLCCCAPRFTRRFASACSAHADSLLITTPTVLPKDLSRTATMTLFDCMRLCSAMRRRRTCGPPAQRSACPVAPVQYRHHH